MNIDTYMKSIKDFPIMTIEEEVEIGGLIDKDNKIRDRFILSNLRLVVCIAHDFKDRGLGLDELVAEGNFGLIKATKTFDYKKSVRFSAHASWWIKNYMRRAIGNNNIVACSRDHRYTMSKIGRVEEALMGKLKRMPTDDEISKEMNVGTRRISNARKNDVRYVISFDYGLHDVMAEESGGIAKKEDEMDKKNKIDVMNRAIRGTLSRRERYVIKNRYGLSGKQLTQVEIGKREGVSRETIRRDESKALKKLKRRLETVL